MPRCMNRRCRALATAAFVLLCGVFIAVDVWRSPPEDERLVFALAVQGHDGQLLASPVVLGAPGQRVQVNLMCRNDPRRERMSLTLDPVDTSHPLRFSYQLSVAGQVDKARGTVELIPGLERKVAVTPENPQGLTLAVFAAPLNHPGVEGYLKERKVRLGRTST